MEPAKIDWKRVESVFVEDELYENINAPKWVDFLAPDDSVYVDDTTWFCRPDCNHPKTAEDFLKISTPVSSKISSFGDKPKSPLGEWSLRDLKLKRRAQIQSLFGQDDRFKLNGDSENRNPNSSMPPLHHSKFVKEMIKSSAEKKTLVCDDMLQTKQTSMKLKSTLSAKNLFAGKDILGHIAEFCNELKRMAIGTKEKDNSGQLNGNEIQGERKEEVLTANDDVNLKEKKPLLEVGIEKSEEIEKRSTKKKLTRKTRLDDEENIPFSLNLENVKSKGEDQQRLLQIRTNPPSPQCFSANRAQAKNATTPLKASKSRLMVPRPQRERGILQEVNQQNKEENSRPDEKDRSISIADGKEARTMDVFWFLKPCTTTTTT